MEGNWGRQEGRGHAGKGHVEVIEIEKVFYRIWI